MTPENNEPPPKKQSVTGDSPHQETYPASQFVVPTSSAAPSLLASQKSRTANNTPFPYSLEAEAACLGCILIRNNLSDEVFKHLQADDFYDGRHRIIAMSILKYRETNGDAAFDIVVLSDLLEKSKNLTRAGGIPYINRLIDAAPSTFNLPQYIKIVSQKSLLRKIIVVAEETLEQARQEIAPVKILDALQQKSFSLLTDRGSDYEHIHPILDRGIDTLERGIGQGTFGIPSHYNDLDKIIIGLQPANLIIIGGRTGMGKTAFALSLLLKAALPLEGQDSGEAFQTRDKLPSKTPNNQGIPVGYFSLEMSKQDIGFRLLSSYARIPLAQFKRQDIKDQHWSEVLDGVDNMKQVPIFIDDTPGISMNELIAKARRMVYQDKVGLIIVDYLQLIGGSDLRMNREQQISMISKQLKNLAREMNIPVVALTQLNRAVEQREKKEPRLSDIRESGAVEQDADIVLLLHRPALDETDRSMDDEPNSSQHETLTHLFVAKNRNGPTGVIDLTFEGEYVRFVDTFR